MKPSSIVRAIVAPALVVLGLGACQDGVTVVHSTAVQQLLINPASGHTGTVSTALPGTAVEGLVVTAQMVVPEGEEELQPQTATAVTDMAGNYTIDFVTAGQYEVTVKTPDGLTTVPESVVVDVDLTNEVTGIDFEIVAE